MAKTYYLGYTKSGAWVGRASREAYGYAWAAADATAPAGKPAVISFSRTQQGAQARINECVKYGRPASNYELVQVQEVDATTYKAATGKR